MDDVGTWKIQLIEEIWNSSANARLYVLLHHQRNIWMIKEIGKITSWYIEAAVPPKVLLGKFFENFYASSRD